jgi:multiple sugar transport system ATP-binding protein
LAAAAAVTSIDLEGVSKRFGNFSAIRGIDLHVASGEFAVFVGPSGCGKSTLLRMIAGLEEISDGTLRIDGERMNEVPAARRGIAMVFQSYALYPHMSVYKNLAFGLETAGFKRGEIDLRVRKAAAVLRIEKLLDRKPRALSGGQRQRVAIGRAIVREPRIFLFDEPLSNLDAELRVQMRVEIAKLHRDLGATMIYVTHDQVEAMTMADKIVVLNEGRIEQVGVPLDLYNHPSNRFVAGFIGSPKMNLLAARLVGSDPGETRVGVAGATVALPLRPARGLAEDGVIFGVRPEHLMIGGGGGLPFAAVRVQLVEQLGGATLIYAALADGQALTIALEGQRRVEPGSLIETRIDPALCHLFAEGGEAFQPAG